jgi:predicted acetyltransferase
LNKIFLKELNKKTNKNFEIFYKNYLIDITKKKIKEDKFKQILNKYKKIKDRKIFIISFRHLVIGFISLTIFKNIFNRKICLINDFYIAKKSRNKKMATNSIHQLLKKIKKNKISECRVEILKSNNKVKKFWKIFRLKKRSSLFTIKI